MNNKEITKHSSIIREEEEITDHPRKREQAQPRTGRFNMP